MANNDVIARPTSFARLLIDHEMKFVNPLVPGGILYISHKAKFVLIRLFKSIA